MDIFSLFNSKLIVINLLEFSERVTFYKKIFYLVDTTHFKITKLILYPINGQRNLKNNYEADNFNGLGMKTKTWERERY